MTARIIGLGAFWQRKALARLAVAHEGPWDPLLEAELHRGHEQWLRGGLGEVAAAADPVREDAAGVRCSARAVNDSVARTGAELLLEWR